jgi:hypothetical protein
VITLQSLSAHFSTGRTAQNSAVIDTVRWKPALNAFAIMFEDRLFPTNQ